MSRKWAWGAAVVILVILLPAGVWVFAFAGPESARITEGQVTDVVYGLGSVEASQVFHLRIGVTSRIERAYIEEGDRVAAGAALVKFDNVPLMKAPFTGTVTRLYYKTGETAFPGLNVLTLMNLERRYLLVTLEERGAMKIRGGQRVRVNFEDYGERIFAGTVKSIYPGEGQFFVYITPGEDLPPEILPGMTADVAIDIEARPALLVPGRALPEDRPPELVVLRDGRRTRVPVRITGRDGERVAVSGKIKAGETVLLND